MRAAGKRAAAVLLCALTLLCAAGCRRKAVVTVVTTDAPPQQTVPVTETSPVPQTAAPPETTAAPPETGSAAAEPETAVSETEAPPETEATAREDTVTLPIELPAANGEMQVSTDPENIFIQAVSAARGLDASLLAAVYAVPASGQNYVFEFTSAGSRTAADLRRVYLLSDDARIRSVAAAAAAEREHISLTENWFCMNVLIKGVIFPSVQEKMQDQGR